MLVELTRAVDQSFKHAAKVMIDYGRSQSAVRKRTELCVAHSLTLLGGPRQTDGGEECERFHTFVAVRGTIWHREPL
jgi:hypothetical protein